MAPPPPPVYAPPRHVYPAPVAYYPPAIHHDPEIFDEPYKFVYNRFVDTEGKGIGNGNGQGKFSKNGKTLRSPVQAFGSLCPGVQFAQLECKWFLLAWFAHMDVQLLANQHTDYNLNNYGNEVVPEVHDVRIRYKLKEKQVPQLSIV